MPTDVDSAAETARFWVTWGQAAGLVGLTAAATAIGASFASKALDKLDDAAVEEMQVDTQRRSRMTLEEAEQLQQQQQQEANQTATK
eukprot:gene8325-8510_t